MLYHYNGKKETYAECKCECGNTKIVSVSNLNAGRTRSCGCFEKISRYNRTHSKLKAGDRFGNLELVRDTGERSKNKCVVWECRCDCGNIVNVISSYLIKGWWTSCGCSDNIIRHHKWNLIGYKYKNLTVVEKDNEMSDNKGKTYWKCICDCGVPVSVPQSNLLNGWSGSCGCQRALGLTAKSIANMLKLKGVEFEQEYRFDDCRDKLCLPFDYYIPSIKTAIEYDGIQHYKPVSLFGGEQAFLLLQKHDEIKTKYCKENNITLIRIPYTKNAEEIKEIIDKL